MSGIAGVWYLDGRVAEPRQLGAMAHAIAHRGPDGGDVWVSGPVGLAHVLLRTVPEARGEVQPLASSDGEVVMVLDGRVDNREELVEALGLARSFLRQPDGALVLAAYQRWGADMLQRILGDFALAIWDARQRHLLVARDHFGIRPLFFVYQPGRVFAFASEIKALRAAGLVRFEPNEVKIAEFLLLPVQPDEGSTYWQGVRSVRPAHRMLVQPGRPVDEQRYWSLDPHREARLGPGDDAYIARFRELFDQAVQCRLRSDRPVGAMLSGGLDSTAIACTAARQLTARGEVLHTYSAVFDSIPEANERSFQEAALAMYPGQMKPHFFAADEVSPLASNERLMWHMDRVNEGINSYIPFELYRQAGEHGLRVMLDGFDGDTTVSHGHAYYLELLWSWRWRSLYRDIRAATLEAGGGRAHARRVFRGWIKFYARHQPALAPLLRVWHARAGRPQQALDQLRISNQGGFWQGEAWRRYMDEGFVGRVRSGLAPQEEDPMWRTERAHHHMMLTRPLMESAMQSFDAKAAAAGVEARYPFYDVRLVEYCLSLPGHLKMRNGWTRWIERAAMEDVLPIDVQWRRGKPDLIASYIAGLTNYQGNTIAAFSEDVREDERLGEYMNTDAIATLAERFVAGDLAERHQEDERVLLYRALVLSQWFEQMDSLSQNMGSHCVSAI